MTTTAPAPAPTPAGRATVADARERERITVEGEVTSLLVRPLADVPTVEARISDATGTLPAVFLGRRRIPGIRLGTRIAVTGVVGARGRQLVILNPEYRLM
jgi:RecG-like helicase